MNEVLPNKFCLSMILFHGKNHKRDFLDVLQNNKNNNNHAYCRADQGRHRC
jgi:hypothetical protein